VIFFLRKWQTQTQIAYHKVDSCEPLNSRYPFVRYGWLRMQYQVPEQVPKGRVIAYHKVDSLCCNKSIRSIFVQHIVLLSLKTTRPFFLVPLYVHLSLVRPLINLVPTPSSSMISVPFRSKYGRYVGTERWMIIVLQSRHAFLLH
jgi:hypothetical protein